MTKWTDKILIKIFDIIHNNPEIKKAPVYSYMSRVGDGAFRVLLSTILSLRTKDETTGPATDRLFEGIETPEEMDLLSEEEISKRIYPVGFYKTKAKQIKKIVKILIDTHQSQVPDDLDTLLELPGVGRKTANLVISVAFQKPAVCVDVHVHRISNRWGFCSTKDPEETEFYIRKNVSEYLWSQFNHPMVALGQVICRPISPKCEQCPLQEYCEKII